MGSRGVPDQDFPAPGRERGTAATTTANAALAHGSANALHRFLALEVAEAVKDDDDVEVMRLPNSGGPYMKAAATIVLEGSAKMRRSFVSHDQHAVASMDHDHAAHVAVIRAL